MGNGYNNQLQNLYKKSSFFPMLCRLSIKDVSISSTYKDHSSSFIDDDPSSPKVSCIGQVKKNNRVNSFPSTNYKLNNSSPDSTPTHHQQHHIIKTTKLMKFFSSKNLIGGGNSVASSPSAAVMKNYKSSRSRSCRSKSNNKREMMVVGGGKRVCRNVNSVLEVNIDKLDPPLPVVKKVQQSGGGGGDEVNLWQRRRFVAVKSLHIQQIQLPNNEDNSDPDPPTTV